MFDLRRRRRVRLALEPTCETGSTGVEGLAFDGNRVLWQRFATGLSAVYIDFMTAAVDDPRIRQVACSNIGLSTSGSDATYDATLPMAGSDRALVYYFRSESRDDCAFRDGRSSEVFRLSGRRNHALYAASRPVGLAVVGNRLGALEDELDCCGHYNPSWSPDGAQLAWIHPRGGRAEILVARPDGTRRRRLALVTADTGAAVVGPAKWAPNGETLAFCVWRYDRSGNGQPELQVVGSDGAGRRSFGEGCDPAWSPDGAKIAFVRGDDLYVVNADGTNEQRLTADAVMPTFEPSWSPDGRELMARRGDRIDLIDPATGAATPIGPVHARDPAWSPDGTLIAFSQRTGDEYEWSIAVMNADGTGQRLLATKHTSADDDGNPAWSPDGRRIAFYRWFADDPEDVKLYVVGTGGGGLHRISEFTTGAAWAPNGHGFAWASRAHRTGGLFVAAGDVTRGHRIAGADTAAVEIRDLRRGTLLRRIVAPGRAEGLAMSKRYIAVVVLRNGKLELRRYRRNGRLLGRRFLPRRTNPNHLAIGPNTIVYGIGRRIVAADAATGRTRLLAHAAAEPVGLSIAGSRVVWAEVLSRRSEIRALPIG